MMMGEIREDHRGRSAYLARALVVFVLTIRRMPVQCRTKLCRKREEFVPVPTVLRPVSVPSADPLLCKDTVPPVPPRLKEVNSVMRASEGNEGWPRADWLPSVTEPLNDIQDPFRVTSLVRASDTLVVQTGRGLVRETIHVRPVV